MSYFTWQKSGLPFQRVIGSGTLLDSARFRYLISNKLSIDSRSIHAHIIGEHGDSEVPLWSLANISGGKILLDEQEREKIFINTRDAAYKIIEAKGATYYAIALALDRICTAILRNEAAVLNVSTLLSEYHGIGDVFMGVPCVVDSSGIREVLPLTLNEAEELLLHQSADKLKALIQSMA